MMTEETFLPTDTLGHTAATCLAETKRSVIVDAIDPKVRSSLGQFMTDPNVARFMAGFFSTKKLDSIRILDPGAGLGILSAATVEKFLRLKNKPKSIELVTYEVHPEVAAGQRETIRALEQVCLGSGVKFSHELRTSDFILDSVERSSSLFGTEEECGYTHIIMNPPYKKISSASQHRKALRQIGIETTNLYTAFMQLSLRLLREKGQLVAIVPRSFCNGTYFRGFRRELDETVSLRRIHIFHSRTKAFKADSVLQENIIFSAERSFVRRQIQVTSSEGNDFSRLDRHRVDYKKIMDSDDRELFLNITVNADEERLLEQMKKLPESLSSLGIDVMTGPIVDFRNRATLVMEPKEGDIPLIYPMNLKRSHTEWPKLNGKKAQGMRDPQGLDRYILPNGNYVLTRRFSSKEEKRRIVATLFSPSDAPGPLVGFENKLNVVHRNREGMTKREALGVWGWLNSTFLDQAFRVFSGHTQVNATDLRALRFPGLGSLSKLGEKLSPETSQEDIDLAIEQIVGVSPLQKLGSV